MDRPAALAPLTADTQWIATVEGDLFPSLHPGIVMGHDISHHCPSLMYGELSLETLARGLELCRKYGLPEEGASICDIGCGIGRAVYRAALLRRWNRCHGVEIYTPRYKLAVEALKRWKERLALAGSVGGDKPSEEEAAHAEAWAQARRMVCDPSGETDVAFTQGDLLEMETEDITYDVLLFVSAAFTDSLLQQMGQAVQDLPVGTLAVCITKSLPCSRWVEVHREEREEPWGRAILIIQRKDT